MYHLRATAFKRLFDGCTVSFCQSGLIKKLCILCSKVLEITNKNSLTNRFEEDGLLTICAKLPLPVSSTLTEEHIYQVKAGTTIGTLNIGIVAFIRFWTTKKINVSLTVWIFFLGLFLNCKDKVFSFNNKHEITSQRYTKNYTKLIHNKFNIGPLFLGKPTRSSLKKNSVWDLPMIKYKTMTMNRSLLSDDR